MGGLSYIKRREKVPSSRVAEPSCSLRSARGKFGDVIPEIDICRAATLMLKRYGERALEESASRADELASAGDDNGVAVWRRISAPSGNRQHCPARPGALTRKGKRQPYRDPPDVVERDFIPPAIVELGRAAMGFAFSSIPGA